MGGCREKESDHTKDGNNTPSRVKDATCVSLMHEAGRLYRGSPPHHPEA